MMVFQPLWSVKISIDNLEGLIKAGMLADVKINYYGIEGSLMMITSESHSHKATSQGKKIVIQVESLCKRYKKLDAVKGIDFTVKQGEIFGLIGPDGAGKTSIFHILGGVMEPSEGQVEVLGSSPRNARSLIGYVPEQLSLYLDLSIDENLEYSAGLGQVPSHLFKQLRAKYLYLMGLDKYKNRLAGNLSGGMKRKLALCCVLVSQPQILLLDEPTTGIDPVSRREFWDDLAAIASEGVTIVVATPYLDEAERCHRIALIQEGAIQQIGTLAQLREGLGCKRLEIRTQEIEDAQSLLMGQLKTSTSQITDLQTFGDRLDILVKNEELGELEVRNIFNQHRLKCNSIKISEPTLENVFVSSLRTRGNDPEFRPFPRFKSVRQDLANHNLKSTEIAISTEKLSKKFGNFQAVKGIDLTIRYGEIYGLLGANGAGKTTTIKMLCGLLAATSGKISLAGKTANLRSHELRQCIGYMSQKFTLYDDLTIVENLEFYCGVYGVPREWQPQKIDWVLETCGLVGKEKLLTGKLPGGWKQRVAFGASVMHEPEILFLDEPTSGVDPLARRQFWRLINDFARQGTAILVTTHYLEEAEHCHRIGFLAAGELVAQGTPSEIKEAQQGQLLEIITDLTQDASDLLKSKLDGWRVSIFGDRLHVVVDHPNLEIREIESILESNNIQIQSLQTIPFSLEDAFIGIVQRS